MSEKDLRKFYDIFSEAWKYLKDHSVPDDTEDFWNKLRDDGSSIGKKYNDPIEHQLITDLIVAANNTIQSYYRRDERCSA